MEVACGGATLVHPRVLAQAGGADGPRLPNGLPDVPAVADVPAPPQARPVAVLGGLVEEGHPRRLRLPVGPRPASPLRLATIGLEVVAEAKAPGQGARLLAGLRPVALQAMARRVTNQPVETSRQTLPVGRPGPAPADGLPSSAAPGDLLRVAGVAPGLARPADALTSTVARPLVEVGAGRVAPKPLLARPQSALDLPLGSGRKPIETTVHEVATACATIVAEDEVLTAPARLVAPLEGLAKVEALEAQLKETQTIALVADLRHRLGTAGRGLVIPDAAVPSTPRRQAHPEELGATSSQEEVAAGLGRPPFEAHQPTLAVRASHLRGAPTLTRALVLPVIHAPTARSRGVEVATPPAPMAPGRDPRTTAKNATSRSQT